MPTWASSGSTNYGTAANWSPANVPTTSETATFDGTSTVNCILDEAMDVASLDVQAGYTGTLDLASTYSHAISGNCTLAGGGTVDLGVSTTITIGGTWDYSGQSTITRGSSTVVMDGTGVTLTPAAIDINAITIAGTVTYDGSAALRVRGAITINASSSLTLSGTGNYIYHNVGGSFTNNGEVIWANTTTTYLYFRGVTNIDLGTLTDNGFAGTNGVVIYRSTTIAGPQTWPVSPLFVADIDAQTITFTGDQTFQDDVDITVNTGDGLTIDTGTNNVNLVIQGSWTFVDNAGTFAWGAAGTGTITLSGTSLATIDLDGQSVEDIIVAKTGSGSVTLSANVTTQSLSINDGVFDIDGNTVTIIGNLSTGGANACQVDDTTGTGAFAITGNIDVNGSSGLECTWNDADITSLGSGTNVADWVTVTNSNNSSGNNITCDSNSTITTSPGWVQAAAGGGLPVLNAYYYG